MDGTFNSYGADCDAIQHRYIHSIWHRSRCSRHFPGPTARTTVVCRFRTEGELQTMADFQHLSSARLWRCNGWNFHEDHEASAVWRFVLLLQAIPSHCCSALRGCQQQFVKYTNAGRPGSMGDAYTWNTSSLLQEISYGTLLPKAAAVSVETIRSVPVL